MDELTEYTATTPNKTKPCPCGSVLEECLVLDAVDGKINYRRVLSCEECDHEEPK